MTMGAPRLLLDDGYLIDGTGAPPVRHGAVLISDEGTIMWAGRSADAPELSPDTRRVDVQGAALLPGFTDTHVHVLSPGGGGTNPLVNATHPASFHVLRAASNLRAALHAGVTTIRDLAGADLGVKQAIEAGLVEGPRIRIAIGLIGPTGGRTPGHERRDRQPGARQKGRRRHRRRRSADGHHHAGQPRPRDHGRQGRPGVQGHQGTHDRTRRAGRSCCPPVSRGS